MLSQFVKVALLSTALSTAVSHGNAQVYDENVQDPFGYDKKVSEITLATLTSLPRAIGESQGLHDGLCKKTIKEIGRHENLSALLNDAGTNFASQISFEVGKKTLTAKNCPDSTEVLDDQVHCVTNNALAAGAGDAENGKGYCAGVLAP